MSKIRVLWFSGLTTGHTPDGKPLTHGGWITELQKRLNASGTVELAIAFPHTDTLFRQNIDGITYYALTKETGKWASLSRFLFFDRQENAELQKMMRVIDDFKPDLIQVFGTEGVFGLIASHIQTPTVIHIQGLMIPYMNAWFPPHYSQNDVKGYKKRWLFRVASYQARREKRILENCRFIMGRTEWDKNLTRLFSPQSTYFHCDEMLRGAFYDASYIPKSGCCDKLQLLSVISTPLYKGHDLILKTAQLLKEELKVDFEWKVYGVWDMTLHEKKWQISGPEYGIRFMGRVSAEELQKCMQESDIYIHPSYIDNSPNSICEAQLMGLAVLACNVGGVPSLIRNEVDGILLPANDPFQLAMQIVRLKEDVQLYRMIGENGRNTALARHNPDKILQDLVNIYKLIFKK